MAAEDQVTEVAHAIAPKLTDWFTANSDLLMQYCVNIISALIILLLVILLLKRSVTVFLKF